MNITPKKGVQLVGLVDQKALSHQSQSYLKFQYWIFKFVQLEISTLHKSQSFNCSIITSLFTDLLFFLNQVFFKRGLKNKQDLCYLSCREERIHNSREKGSGNGNNIEASHFTRRRRYSVIVSGVESLAWLRNKAPKKSSEMHNPIKSETFVTFTLTAAALQEARGASATDTGSAARCTRGPQPWGKTTYSPRLARSEIDPSSPGGVLATYGGSFITVTLSRFDGWRAWRVRLNRAFNRY